MVSSKEVIAKGVGRKYVEPRDPIKTDDEFRETEGDERERERNMRTYRFTSGASLPPRLLISRLMGYLRTIFRFE